MAKNYTENGPGDEVVLKFSGLDGVPEDTGVLLLDQLLAQTVDLRQRTQYSFLLGKKKPVAYPLEARFAILVGSEAYIDQELNDHSNMPKQTTLHENFPNPFNPSTVIRFDLVNAGNVSVKIYDLSGSLVKTLYSDYTEPGGYEFAWNGTDANGKRVSSGVYFYRLQAGDFIETKNMTLLK